MIPESEAIPLNLSFHGRRWIVNCPKDAIFGMHVGFIFPVGLRLPPQEQIPGKFTEFIVFEVHVNSQFGLEQVGSGYPCQDEKKANEIAQLVKDKNIKVPFVALGAWRGGFAIIVMSNMEAWYDELVLFRYHQPQQIGSETSTFSLRQYKRCLGKSTQLISEEMLPTTDAVIAEKCFQQKNNALNAQLELERRAAIRVPEDPTNASLLRESQFIVLSRAFPETVQLMRNTKNVTRKELYAAYQRDILVLTGEVFDPLTFNSDQFWKTVTAIDNQRKRGKRKIDPVEYELVAGWFHRGYGAMTPSDRAIELKKRGLPIMSGEAIRKICYKLKLPPIRRPGFH